MKTKTPKKSKSPKKVRKKRTTIKEAYENGYNDCKNLLICYTLDIVDNMIEEYNIDMQRFPRNTKFVELQVDSIDELRRRLLYNEDYAKYNEVNSLERSRVRPQIQSQ
jgi:hypothetical protein